MLNLTECIPFIWTTEAEWGKEQSDTGQARALFSVGQEGGWKYVFTDQLYPILHVFFPNNDPGGLSIQCSFQKESSQVNSS